MPLALPLDPASAVPLHRQLHEGLRAMVLDGRLGAGAKAPSTRALATHLAVSRTTVATAYDDLVAEGYFEARAGAGTFVATSLPESLLRAHAPHADGHGAPGPLPASAYARRLAVAGPLRGASGAGAIAFGHYGRPATDEFPLEVWRRLLARHARPGHARLDYAPDAAGHPALRAAIARHLVASRAVRCTPEHVVIVSGSQQALDVIARLAIDPGDTVAIEDPGYLGARHAFATQGAVVAPVPVDEDGLVVSALPEGARLVHVTPSHQFPTGAVLSLPRRLALLDWARRRGALVVEDDYDSEYRWGDRPLPALQGLDAAGVVLYVGTFSKVLFPALRVGYMVVPSAWVPHVERAKHLTDRHGPTLEQQALADFIAEGHLERHLRRMRGLYAERRAAMLEALAEHLGDRATVLGAHAGIHLTLRLRGLADAEAIVAAAAAEGVGVASTAACHMGAPEGVELVLGYGDLPPERIREGVRRLARAIGRPG